MDPINEVVVSEAENVQKFMRLLDLKKLAAEIREEEKALREHFLGIANDKLAGTEGLGRLIIIEDSMNGLVFSTKKGQPSVTKLKELGLTKEQIDSTKGSYVAMEVF